MTTIANLKNDINEARKTRDQEKLKVLTLLMSKVQRIAKDDGNRPEKDEDLIQGVSRYKKEVEETRERLEAAGRDTSEQAREIEIVSVYLPVQMTDEELDAEIEKALEGVERTKKAMGVVMKHLTSNFKGQYDPKRANVLVSAKLA